MGVFEMKKDETNNQPSQEQINEWQENKEKAIKELQELFEKDPEQKKAFEKATEGVQHPYH